MKNRIVLSSLALLLLISCGYDGQLDDEPDETAVVGSSDYQVQTEPAPAPFWRSTRGIGTSPSVQACGIWVAGSQQAAIEQSDSRVPDIVQFALPGGLSCSEALRIAREWPEPRGAWVRYWNP